MLLLLGVPVLAQAQTATVVPRVAIGEGTAAKPNFKDCYQVIRNDSVRLFYDADYLLTPSACASIRRLTRITPDGNFTGEARDYWMDENVLALRVRYVNGKADGPIEQFARSGKPVVRGQLAQGVPTGEWHYWYANGQPRQVLRFPAEGGFRIVAYWDSTGARRATDGNGYWEGAPPPNYVTSGSGAWLPERTYFRFRGPVAEGLPHGQWQSIDTRTNQPFSDEMFSRGRFRSGQLSTKPRYGSAVLTTPKVVLEMEAPGATAERFRLGLACAERERRQQLRAEFEQLAMPKNALSFEAYGQQLHRKLLNFSNQPWYAQLPANAPVVCGIDSLGNVTTVLAASGPLQAVVREAVKDLPRWTPATVRGHYALCGFVVRLDRGRDQVRINPMANTGQIAWTPQLVQAYWEAVLARELGKTP
ncbi:hypothetical protein LJ737_02410 [Hymenobacter sp. 15J16-1T3B]|uniref:toxin-antitoxin system YwqK family antitoxin n=1 Tax=Hymenobacter sp. 15J16-1T3B TaxID=2886941 RepID=UPI001D119DF2|nr:hypothetical protein [Hymenobacter sp. 15J16-1T3B]MCC3156068.1 hypothetical protein [Hymenobacter sp. 15J16-1T3B]